MVIVPLVRADRCSEPVSLTTSMFVALNGLRDMSTPSLPSDPRVDQLSSARFVVRTGDMNRPGSSTAGSPSVARVRRQIIMDVDVRTAMTGESFHHKNFGNV